MVKYLKNRVVVTALAIGFALGILLGVFLISRSENTTPKIPNFDHIFVIIEENYGYEDIINNPDAEFINSLAKNYSLASNYFALGHPSLPNYIKLTSGTDAGITDNCEPSDPGCLVNVPNIADSIEKSGRSWRGYFEDMDNSCNPKSNELYDIEHNPFLYYRDIATSSKRCNDHVVPLGQLYADLLSPESLPNFVFIVPNLCNDMHNCGIEPGDRWLAQVVPQILNSRAASIKNSLLVITWDESEHSDKSDQIPLIMVGGEVRQGYRSDRLYDHYSLLHTIEAAWDLPPLTSNDKNARVMSDFFTP